ncbi:hypothetical protein GCM10009609_57010 [Pseudonocardia aurantiaca]
MEPSVERAAVPSMPPSGSTRRRRPRGEIEALPSGSLRVRVYAGIDPISGKRHYLSEVIPAGKDAAKLAEKARTRMQAEVDERDRPADPPRASVVCSKWPGPSCTGARPRPGGCASCSTASGPPGQH